MATGFRQRIRLLFPSACGRLRKRPAPRRRQARRDEALPYRGRRDRRYMPCGRARTLGSRLSRRARRDSLRAPRHTASPNRLARRSWQAADVARNENEGVVGPLVVAEKDVFGGNLWRTVESRGVTETAADAVGREDQRIPASDGKRAWAKRRQLIADDAAAQ